ncbi:DUF2515 family protein [Paraburkholderia sp. J67]|uniref:DUF2515 family protein n=1 Tax=Paraburkholderia sp. J67 TaxID=2805435 RepID=UPI002ABD9839|nr:hypothetical protein [Paraburkholderia sp. J67]
MDTLAQSKTDPESNTCVDAHCNCKFVWSLAQQYAMAQLDTRTPILKNGTPDYRFSSHSIKETPIESGDASFVGTKYFHYAARAQRVASSYARMFLEKFHLGDESKLGRFDWTGLGAFAAKQVACNIKSWQVEDNPLMGVVHDALGKGNLWIYNDLLPWCYGYAADPESFEKCAIERDSREFHETVKSNLMRQKWAAEVVPKCPVVNESSKSYGDDNGPGDAGSGAPIGKDTENPGYFKWTPRVSIGFDFVKNWETTADKKKKSSLAFNHLWVMAQHEQGEVLQCLIYNDKAFMDKLAFQRKMDKATSSDKWWLSPLRPLNAMIPPLQLSFTADEYADDNQYRSDAKKDGPPDMKLEDYVERMAWIKKTRELFHYLMNKKKAYMVAELNKIAATGGMT